MAELTLKSGDAEKDGKTIAADIGMAGVHIFVDKGFFDRVAKLKSAFDEYLTDKEINDMGLTPKRTMILKQAMHKLANAWEQFAYGKAGEKPKLASAFAACREMILIVEECVESDNSDDEVVLLCRERLSYIDIPTLYTFDSANTTINKAFTVSGQMPQRSPETPGKPTA